MNITGLINKIIFHDEKDGYGCILLNTDDGKSVYCKGILGPFHKDLPVTLYGEYHKTGSGYYFSFNKYILTDDNYRIIKSFDLFTEEENRRLAKELPDLYLAIENANSLKQFENTTGLESKYAKLIYTKLKRIKQDKDLFTFILDNDGRYTDYIKITRLYNDAKNKLLLDPYKYGFEAGFKYKTCNNIARKMNISDISKIKVAGILRYMVKDALLRGDTYLEISDIENKIKKYNKVDNETYQIPTEYIVDIAKLSEEYIVTDEIITKLHIWNEEMRIAKAITAIEKLSTHKEVDYKLFDEICKEANITLSTSQKEALPCVEKNGFSVITGGPGSGKTTLVNLLLTYFKKTIPEEEICLCAPTGCAAQNLSQKTGMKAETIHKALGITPYSDTKNVITKQINAKVCVVDECSMLDTNLAYLLFTSLPKDAHIILVGDVDQVESVSYGRVFADIIESELIPVYRLKEVHRQSGDSSIVVNANKIINGKEDLVQDNTFNIITVLSSEDAYDIATSYVKNISDVNSYQILSPIKKTYGGIYKLNSGIQESVNIEKKVLFKYGAYNFKMHDRVIMVNNNYDKGYFNGDIGKIIDADDFGLEVEFPNKKIYIEKNNFEDIALAYAITIHKSQGSEYENIVIVLTDDSISMSNRNLIYTAITRAKKSVTIIETEGALNAAIHKINPRRKSMLCKWLTK